MKYDPLKNHLAKLTRNQWVATFTEIEKVLGFPLPRSAREYPAWWANQSYGTQTNAWVGVGWKTTGLNLVSEKITFTRDNAKISKEITKKIAPTSNNQVKTDAPTDWFWEGNVVNSLAHYLIGKGWTIEGRADTHTKEQGIDLKASKNGTSLLIEAKGYPSTGYRDNRRAGELKSTPPSSQAQHWYSHALLKALRLQTTHPNAKVALAFPDFPRYRNLFEETKKGLGKLGLAVLMVSKAGEVWEWGL